LIVEILGYGSVFSAKVGALVEFGELGFGVGCGMSGYPNGGSGLSVS
jgi:hypothetical protein